MNLTFSKNVVTGVGRSGRPLRLSVSRGNIKTGGIPAVSLTPGASCPKGVLCRLKCYALKAYELYKQTTPAWDRNYELFRDDLAAAEEMVVAWLARRRRAPKVFRIHVSGDFLHQEHFDAWDRIARQFPATVFFAYTKNTVLDLSRRADNLVVRRSRWIGDADIPDDVPYAWYQDGTEDRIPINAVDCRATLGHDITCDHCGVCWNSKRDVVLYAH